LTFSGGSAASYDNERATTTFSMWDATESLSVLFSAEAGIYAAGQFSTCAGLGVEACMEMADFSVGASVSIDISSGITMSRANEVSATASFSFSYATSGEPDLAGDPTGAGHDSTMFLVPSLNIVFSKSLMVEYSPMTCMATGTEVTSWSLTGSNNFKV
jgi:hypothetical protein